MFNTGKKLPLRFSPWRTTAAGLLLLTMGLTTMAAREVTVEELKARLSSASARERPRLCVEIAALQLTAAEKFYANGDDQKGGAALNEVAAFCESARDSSIQSGKRLKQTEIAVRQMARKLTDLKFSLTRDEQSAVQGTLDRLQRVRDDLLAAMFPKG
jgi:hypothetical protein